MLIEITEKLGIKVQEAFECGERIRRQTDLLIENGVTDLMSVATAPTLTASEAP